MKKFKFSLSRMLDYKDQMLEKEKNELMLLRSKRDAVVQKIADLEDEFEQVNIAVQEESKKGITVLQLKCYDYQMENIRHQIKQLQKELKLIEAAVERQLKVVIALSQEVSGLDKLQEKQLDEYNYVQAKAEELVISEFVSSNIIRQKQA